MPHRIFLRDRLSGIGVHGLIGLVAIRNVAVGFRIFPIEYGIHNPDRCGVVGEPMASAPTLELEALARVDRVGTHRAIRNDNRLSIGVHYEVRGMGQIWCWWQRIELIRRVRQFVHRPAGHRGNGGTFCC